MLKVHKFIESVLSDPEFKLVLEKSCDKITISMHPLPIPARVGNHNCCNTLADGGGICRHVNVEQSIPINYSVVFINALNRATISNKMLSAGNNFVSTK